MISICKNDICSRDYGSFTVIYDLRNKMILKLENVAADIWNYIYLNENVTFDEIVDFITSTYDCSEEDVFGDIEYFLEDLFTTGVIKINHKYAEISESSLQNTQKVVDDFEGSIIQDLQEIDQLYSVTFEMTYSCNEKCIHCYAHEAGNSAITYQIPLQTYKNLLDQLYEMKCMHISFTGGDPFMYKNFIDVYNYARKKGFVCDIFTNALFLSDHKSYMDEIVKSRPRAFYISLYGANSKTHDSVTGICGSFEKTLKAVRYLKASGIAVVFNIMILSVNHKEIEDIISLSKELGVEYRISMSLIYTNSGNDSPMKYFLNDKKDIKKILYAVRENMYSFDVALNDIKIGDYMCGAGVTSLSVSPEGDIYPCISLKKKLGNIATDTFENIWHGNKRTEIIKTLKWENTTECKKCEYQLNCPHCVGISQAETGDCFSCNTCDRLIAQCLTEILETVSKSV